MLELLQVFPENKNNNKSKIINRKKYIEIIVIINVKLERKARADFITIEVLTY